MAQAKRLAHKARAARHQSAAALSQLASPAPSEQESPAPISAEARDAALKSLPQEPRVMLSRLNGLGLSEGVRRNLEALVLSHLRQMPHKIIIEPEAVRKRWLEPGMAELERCNDGLQCLTQRGAAMHADIVVYGTVSALGNDYSLNLRALKVADGFELGKQIATLSGNLDQLIPQIRLITYALLAPDAIWGSLMIDTALAGIDVEVDGIKQAPTPWSAPLGHLAPGRHTVRLDAFTSTHSLVAVEVVAFETSQVQVELGRGLKAGLAEASQTPTANANVTITLPAAPTVQAPAKDNAPASNAAASSATKTVPTP